MPKRRAMRRRGFTLIELLATLTILTILAAILAPVFARAREQARQGVCISNMKQIATGMQIYCDDYDHRYPLELDWNGGDQPLFPNRAQLTRRCATGWRGWRGRRTRRLPGCRSRRRARLDARHCIRIHARFGHQVERNVPPRRRHGGRQYRSDT